MQRAPQKKDRLTSDTRIVLEQVDSVNSEVISAHTLRNVADLKSLLLRNSVRLPSRQARSHIRILGIGKRNPVLAVRSVWAKVSEELEQKLRTVESSEDGNDVVELVGEVVVSALGRVLENSAAASVEDKISKDGGDALELGSDGVEKTSVEGSTLGDVLRVERQDVVDGGIGGSGQNELHQLLNISGSRGVKSHNSENGTFIFLGSDNERNRGNTVLLVESESIVRQNIAIRARRERQELRQETESLRQGVRVLGSNNVGQGLASETGQHSSTVIADSAAGLLDNSVELSRGSVRVSSKVRKGTTGLQDGAVEEGLSIIGVVTTVSSELVSNGHGTGRLTKDSNVVGVTTEAGNVVSNPLETETLVVQTGVGAAFSQHVGATQETVGTETVTDGNVDDRLVHVNGVVNELVTGVGGRGTSDESTAVNPDHDRKLVSGLGSLGSENIEVQTVLRHGERTIDHVVQGGLQSTRDNGCKVESVIQDSKDLGGINLHARISEVISLEALVSSGVRNRVLESQVTNGRVSKWNTLEGLDVALKNTRDGLILDKSGGHWNGSTKNRSSKGGCQ